MLPVPYGNLTGYFLPCITIAVSISRQTVRHRQNNFPRQHHQAVNYRKVIYLMSRLEKNSCSHLLLSRNFLRVLSPTLAPHYIDVIMTTVASQITSLTVVYSAVYSDADQRKHQSSASLAFVWGIHRDRWIRRTKGQLRGKWFHLMTSSCFLCIPRTHCTLETRQRYMSTGPFFSLYHCKVFANERRRYIFVRSSSIGLHLAFPNTGRHWWILLTKGQ